MCRRMLVKKNVVVCPRRDRMGWGCGESRYRLVRFMMAIGHSLVLANKDVVSFSAAWRQLARLWAVSKGGGWEIMRDIPTGRVFSYTRWPLYNDGKSGTAPFACAVR